MWSERRCFQFNEPPTVDGESSSFITCMEYVAVPFDDARAWASSASWYTTGDGTEDNSEDDEAWRQSTPQCLEYFILGWDSGAVERRVIVPSGMQWVGPSEGKNGGPCGAVDTLYQHSGQVMCVTTLGTLVASVSCGSSHAAKKGTPENVVTVASSHPLYAVPRQPVCLRHPSLRNGAARCTPRSVMLWEGRPEWGREAGDDEASVVYAFVADEQGRVRLWRVDLVACHNTDNSSESSTLLAVFGCILHGHLGDAPLRSCSATAAPPPSFEANTRLLSLCLDSDDRLIAGTNDKKIYVWDLSTIDRRRRRTTDWGEPLSTNVRRFADSKLFQAFVWLTPPLESSSNVIDSDADVNKLRQRWAAIAASNGGLIGQVVNCVAPAPAETTPAASVHLSKPSTALSMYYSVSFEGLSKPLDCSIENMQVMNNSALAFIADDRGAVHSVAALHDGLVVSGGADGGVKLWCWNIDARRYVPLRSVPLAHRDLITRVGVLCPPSTFFSVSLDGFVRTWRLHADGLRLSEESSVYVRPGSGWRGEGDGGAEEMASSARRWRMLKLANGECGAPIGAACVHRDFGALFVLLHMTTVTRSYVFVDADTCALPPELAFDGLRTVARSSSTVNNAIAEDNDDGGVKDSEASNLHEIVAALEQDDDVESSSTVSEGEGE